ncbi:uncharacterized protein L969DRAFT_94030 [Mixia osmundae IAM 14324]|uniref:uncharacterized protein n=1 Tax=Mixia osmundae (strain CBS 9802 / IAM 14324 / JCM 22182 / KY 12970) TaxID=764103 RepID=UPI0004A5475F|nr:uncharacterized protein L969DRAFT_94030 [Mixia osmundae IAM 14324]KEI40211.1 hypothetical protein L969DRAFT_94030 [Mixia osmundae IAM 14324]
MLFKSLFTAALGATAVIAAPLGLEKRQSGGNLTDADIFAADFASAGFPEWVRYRVSEIANHERSHVEFLTTALRAAGATPVSKCNYTFPVTSVDTFLAVAVILEGVGISAYLGAAASIASKAYLTYAGSILSIETRHNTWLRSSAMNESPFPSAYEAYNSPDAVFSLAAPFIDPKCSQIAALPLMAFPALAASKTAANAGDKVTFKTNATGGTTLAIVRPLGNQYFNYTQGESFTIPKGVQGQTYFILSSSESIADDAVVAGPAVIEIADKATLYNYNNVTVGFDGPQYNID